MDWGTVTSLAYQDGLGILDLGVMNKALVAKWIYFYTNSKNALRRKIVYAMSKGGHNSLMSALGNRNNRSILLSFVDSASGTND